MTERRRTPTQITRREAVLLCLGSILISAALMFAVVNLAGVGTRTVLSAVESEAKLLITEMLEHRHRNETLHNYIVTDLECLLTQPPSRGKKELLECRAVARSRASQVKIPGSEPEGR